MHFGFAQSSPSVDSIGMYLELADVVVTAQYAPTDSRNALYKIRTIKRDVIEQRGAINLEQLLNQELNIRISQDLILGSSLSLQGVSGQNVKIMIDGVPVIGRVGDDIDLSQINLSNIERVELIEGPMSVHYGTNALGGVVNLITKKSQINKFDFQVISQVESIGAQNLNAQAGARLSDKLLLRLDGGYNNFAGFNALAPSDSLLARTFQWNPKEQWFANGILRYDINGAQSLRYSMSLFDEQIENLGQLRRPQFRPYAFDDFYYTRRLDHVLSYEGTFLKNLYWNITSGYNTFRRQKNTLRTEMESREQSEVPGQQDTTRYNALVFRPILASRFGDSPFNFQIGLDINYENGYGQRFRDAAASKAQFSEIADYAGFITLQYQPVSALQIQVGARGAYNTRFDAPIIPSLHLKYDINKTWQLRASYAQGFRSPSIKELFFYFVDASHYIIGNPDLLAETSDNVQFILDYDQKWNISRLQVTLTGFYNDIRNKIDLFDYVEINGELVPAASLGQNTTQFAYFNQDRFKALGSNIRINYSLKNLEIAAGIAPTGRYNPLSETENVAAYTFTNELNGQVNYHFNKIGLRTAFFIRYNDKFIRFYQTVNQEGNTVVAQAIQDGFTLADLTLTKAFWKNRLQLTSGVRNLLDIRNVNTIGTQGSAHSGDGSSSPIATGRNYFARLRWQLNGR
ncbi:MAG TPA: TonB-dependent receptor [Saprospiraceae bacterium]|nr:TonB-dependent receptor [Saprospiraceae bacterium]HMP14745.1 TonB-dependent receptor [Saprospiraceae bacterium]